MWGIHFLGKWSCDHHFVAQCGVKERLGWSDADQLICKLSSTQSILDCPAKILVSCLSISLCRTTAYTNRFRCVTTMWFISDVAKGILMQLSSSELTQRKNHTMLDNARSNPGKALYIHVDTGNADRRRGG